MQNINPLFFLIGLVPLSFSILLLIYWRKKRVLKWIVLLYSLIAYAGAIALKYAIQIPTYSTLKSMYGSPSLVIALYFGLQTVFLEVGGAYLVARYAIRRKTLEKADAESYGISLSFWENGVLIGLLTSINLVSYFLIIGYGPAPLAQSVHNILIKNQPGLFDTGYPAVLNVFLSILERVSSAMAHIAWGILTLLAAAVNKRRYLYMALPMGLLDALVPYAGSMGIVRFEIVIFVLALCFLLIAVYVERSLRKNSGSPRSE